MNLNVENKELKRTYYRDIIIIKPVFNKYTNKLY